MRVLFIHNHPSKFVEIDLALVRERYLVREWYQRSRAVDLIALANAVQQSDVVLGWFASWHTFFPVLLARLLKRPAAVITGGYDTANLRELGYGSQRGGLKRWVARTTMQNATHLITNSNYSRSEIIENARLGAKPVTVIYHGLEIVGGRANPKENHVITVGNVDRVNLQRKGLELFVRAAVECPEKNFTLIGAWRDDAIRRLRALAPPNANFTGWVSDDELRHYFARAQVYVQASRHEGFGLAVAEAMLHECVPVVTRAGALPEVVGDAGVYVELWEPGAVAEGVRRAFAQAQTIGPRARQRIAEEFPLGRRREKLYDLLDSLKLTG